MVVSVVVVNCNVIVYVTAYLSEDSVASRQTNYEFWILICSMHSVYHKN